MTSRPRSRGSTIGVRTRVAFSVEPSTIASGCLTPVDVDAQRDNAAVFGEGHAVDHQRSQVPIMLGPRNRHCRSFRCGLISDSTPAN